MILMIMLLMSFADLFQNQCDLNRKGHSSRGMCLVSTKKKATKVVITATQMAKKRNVAHCIP